MERNDNKPLRPTHPGAVPKNKRISRRSFIKGSAVLGASSLLGTNVLGMMQNIAFAEARVDIAAVKGTDYFKSTTKAVELLGGMGRFVPKQSKVALLINSSWDNPGSFVKPEITLAVLHMCLQAGAKEIGVIKSLSSSYWRSSPLSEKYSAEIDKVESIGGGLLGGYEDVSIPKGRSLKKAEVAKGLLECDVFINMPIAKNHIGVRFTGTLKNMMGASPYSSNRFFHHGSGASGSYDDVEFLAQCIADLNLVRKPDLCILDATEVLQSNGPSGPGKLARPQVVLAGTDRVALDVYGADLLGLKGDEILAARKAHEHGLGEIDLSRVKIQEASV